jgi:uncharacterized protein (DUF1330 family)
MIDTGDYWIQISYLGDTICAFKEIQNIMSAFLIIHSKLTNPEAFQDYVVASEDSLKLHEGKYLLGGELDMVLEGEHDKSRTVIFQFPSSQHAKDWYTGDEYQKVKYLRDNTGEFDFVLVDSF